MVSDESTAGNVEFESEASFVSESWTPAMKRARQNRALEKFELSLLDQAPGRSRQ